MSTTDPKPHRDVSEVTATVHEVPKARPKMHLKPCPFCGVVPTIKRIQGGGAATSNTVHGDTFLIECMNGNCLAIVSTMWSNSRKEQIERWNKRFKESNP